MEMIDRYPMNPMKLRGAFVTTEYVIKIQRRASKTKKTNA